MSSVPEKAEEPPPLPATGRPIVVRTLSTAGQVRNSDVQNI
jgi:hypothetical protein